MQNLPRRCESEFVFCVKIFDDWRAHQSVRITVNSVCSRHADVWVWLSTALDLHRCTSFLSGSLSLSSNSLGFLHQSSWRIFAVFFASPFCFLSYILVDLFLGSSRTSLASYLICSIKFPSNSRVKCFLVKHWFVLGNICVKTTIWWLFFVCWMWRLFIVIFLHISMWISLSIFLITKGEFSKNEDKCLRWAFWHLFTYSSI